MLNGCLPLSSNSNSVEPYNRNGIFFDTLISITIYDNSSEKAEAILDQSIKLCEKYQKMLDPNDADSDIYKINHSNGLPVIVNEETLFLIESSKKYSDLSSGLFDISVYPLSSLWNFNSETPSVPDNSKIQSLLTHIDYSKIDICLSDSTVTLKDSSAKIELGGIAKGYIADKLAQYIFSENVTGALINIGGDMQAVGTKDGTSKFHIGITDPFGNSTPISSVYIENKAIATSGTYERCFEENGINYHHILNPQTGYPVDTDIKSVSIICNNSTDADTLCTICILYGSTKALELINSIPETEAVIIKNDGSIITSQNASDYITP